jgi:hypothetical protein
VFDHLAAVEHAQIPVDECRLDARLGQPSTRAAGELGGAARHLRGIALNGQARTDAGSPAESVILVEVTWIGLVEPRTTKPARSSTLTHRTDGDGVGPRNLSCHVVPSQDTWIRYSAP